MLSRLRSLKWLILTFSLSLDYVRKFLPPLKVIRAVRTLVADIVISPDAPVSEIEKFQKWKSTQLEYSFEAERLLNLK